MSLRRLLTLSVVLASTLVSFEAHADVQACLAASEKGQRARGAGKLREARDLFLVCGGEGCPSVVRRDCAQWQGEVIGMLPSVVFGAKDKSGRDLFDVTVSMDGELLVKKLDGKSIIVDPGPHTFKFEMAGSPPIIERALVKEGEKTRVIAVSFGEGAATTSTDGNGNGNTPPADPDKAKGKGKAEGGHTILPWVVVGVGAATVIAGLVVLLTAPSLPEGCAMASKTCAKIPGEDAATFAKRQETAGRSEAQPTEGLIVGGIGLAVLGGGLLWHFLEPTGPERSGSLRVTPWAGPGSTGASLGGTF
jgi:hypothetical protein